MSVARHQQQDSDRADLDGAAAAYALAWAQSGPAGRRRLREDLLGRLLPFADRLASRYRERSEPLDDLRQVARLGLVKAVDRYNPELGSFTAFAVSTIRGEIKRHFRDNTWDVHVTRRLQDLALRVGQAESVLTARLARPPVTGELARHLGVTEDEVVHAQACANAHTAVPLSTPTGTDSSQVLADVLADAADGLGDVPDRLTMDQLIRRLPARTQHIIALRFYGNLTQSQIAEMFGISQMHVSRLLSQALTWLRAALLTDTRPPWPGADGGDDDHLRIRTTEADGVVTVMVGGEADRDVATRLRLALHAAVAAARAGRVVVDVRGLALVDVAGAAVLRDAAVAAALRDVTIVVQGIQPYVATALAAVGMPVPAGGNRLVLGRPARAGATGHAAGRNFR